MCVYVCVKWYDRPRTQSKLAIVVHLAIVVCCFVVFVLENTLDVHSLQLNAHNAPSTAVVFLPSTVHYQGGTLTLTPRCWQLVSIPLIKNVVKRPFQLFSELPPLPPTCTLAGCISPRSLSAVHPMGFVCTDGITACASWALASWREFSSTWQVPYISYFYGQSHEQGVGPYA